MLIAMAVYDTVENQRTDQTRRTLISLSNTVDWTRHSLIISDNGSCQATLDLYQKMMEGTSGLPIRIIYNGENLGTARAINRAWSYRLLGQHAVKMDNDVVIHQVGWADEIEEVFARDSTIGICGLKRKDLEERPDHQVPVYQSKLKMLPHKPGQRWIVVEEVLHVMGTCQAFSSALMNKIGFLYQGQDEGKVYGLDDTLASYRSHLAGFRTVFLPHIEIDHIDPGGNEYTIWKQKVAGENMGMHGRENWLDRVKSEYRTGKRSLYYDGGDDGVFFQKTIPNTGDF